jgi:hypothetical protein
VKTGALQVPLPSQVPELKPTLHAVPAETGVSCQVPSQPHVQESHALLGGRGPQRESASEVLPVLLSSPDSDGGAAEHATRGNAIESAPARARVERV